MRSPVRASTTPGSQGPASEPGFVPSPCGQAHARESSADLASGAATSWLYDPGKGPGLSGLLTEGMPCGDAWGCRCAARGRSPAEDPGAPLPREERMTNPETPGSTCRGCGWGGGQSGGCTWASRVGTLCGGPASRSLPTSSHIPGDLPEAACPPGPLPGLAPQRLSGRGRGVNLRPGLAKPRSPCPALADSLP